MKNGSIPQRALKRLKDSKVKVFSTKDLAGFSAAGSNRSRIVRTLQSEGKIEALGPGRYLLLDNEPRTVLNRAWSAPGVKQSQDKVMFMTLANPTFLDVARLCRSFGLKRVRGALDKLVLLNEVNPTFAAAWHGRINNIEEGFRDAASRHDAARNRAAVR